MILLFVPLAFLILGLFYLYIRRDLENAEGAFLLSLLSAIMLIDFVIAAQMVYPNLLKEKTRALVLKAEIDRVKKVYYPSLQKNSSLIEGNIANFKQSTTVTKYIQKYVSAKAKYNGDLAFYRIAIKSGFFRIFGYHLFIDKRVLKLKPLEWS